MSLPAPALARRLDRIDRLARLLEARWHLFGVPVGLDAVIGLVPVAGDLAGAVVGGWIVLEAIRLGAGRGVVARMVLNLGIDFVLGSLPVLGDGFDLLFRANLRNAALLRRTLEAAAADR